MNNRNFHTSTSEEELLKQIELLETQIELLRLSTEEATSQSITAQAFSERKETSIKAKLRSRISSSLGVQTLIKVIWS